MSVRLKRGLQYFKALNYTENTTTLCLNKVIKLSLFPISVLHFSKMIVIKVFEMVKVRVVAHCEPQIAVMHVVRERGVKETLG